MLKLKITISALYLAIMFLVTYGCISAVNNSWTLMSGWFTSPLALVAWLVSISTLNSLLVKAKSRLSRMSVFSIGDHNWEFFTYDRIWYKSNDATCKDCGYSVIYSSSLGWFPRNAAEADWDGNTDPPTVTHPTCPEYIMKKVLE